MNVVFAADEKFPPGLWGAILSTVASCSRPDELVIHTIDCGLTEDSWNKLNRAITTHSTPPKLIRARFPLERLGRLHLPPGKSALTYARLFFPDVLDCETVLHVDADMLVFRDVLELKKIDLSNSAGATARSQDGDLLTFDLPTECCEHNGLDPKSPCYYAGLSYINLGEWQRQSLNQCCLDFMKHWNPTYVDQTVINATRQLTKQFCES